MKRLNILICSIIFSITISAQGNLQFDSVLFLEMLSDNATHINVYDTLVVPTGQVLKITSVYCGDEDNVVSTGDEAFVGLKKSTTANFTIIAHGYADSEGNGRFFSPIWLGSGTYHFILENANTTANTALISGLYFNVVP